MEDHDDENHLPLQEFNPCVSGAGSSITNLSDIVGEDLYKVLPEEFCTLYFEGNVDSSFSEYKRVLDLLQSNRRWDFIKISDMDRERASPDFLSLVALAPTKTNEVFLTDCPLDLNFFACFHSGIQTLKILSIESSSIPISFEAASVLANSLASTTSLERLVILAGARFDEDDDGAGLKLAEGIQRNNSLEVLIIDEASTGSEAVTSILGTVAEGELPKLSFLSITFQAQSEVHSRLVTKLMSSCKSNLETLIVGRQTPTRRNILWSEDGARRGENVNRQLKSLRMWDCSLDQSYLTWILPMMPMLESISLDGCGISDLTPTIDYLRQPSCAVKSLSLKNNNIGVDQVEKFVSYLGDMPSLAILKMGRNPWCNDEGDEERIKYNLTSNLRINRAWRRDLWYDNKKSLGNVPSNLFPLIAARALRSIAKDMCSDPSLGPSAIFALLHERNCDLIID